MTPDDQTLESVAKTLLPEARRLLEKLIAEPSLSGRESTALERLEDAFRPLSASTEVRRIPMCDELKQDEHYSSPIEGLDYADRYNLHVRLGPAASATRLIINGHLDVVPPSPGMSHAFTPRFDEGVLYGRGACDDKGPVVSAWLACAILDRIGFRPKEGISLHFVCEEENGGNGTLAMVREGEMADACIVLEPTALHPVPSVRGAVWFRLRFFGAAAHSGSAQRQRSALTLARRAMELLEEYHRDLVEASRGIPFFERLPAPMPLTFGRLQAGNWPAASPSEAVLEGVFGFLPNQNYATLCREIRELLESKLGNEGEIFQFETTYRHDCSISEPEHWIPRMIGICGKRQHRELAPVAFPASCDAWFYRVFQDIPTYVFGPGDLRHAHSADEQIELGEIADAAVILAHLMIEAATAAPHSPSTSTP